MLKFLFFFSAMMILCGNWFCVLCSMFLGWLLLSSFSSLGNFLGGLGFFFGVDFISLSLIMLSVWISALVVMSSQSVYNSNNHIYLFLSVNILLLLSLILTFSSMDYLLFYICFESSLIPIFILILGWGYQPERLQAGVYMLFYTLFGSLPLLISLLSLYYFKGSLTMNINDMISESDFITSIWYFCSIFGFLIKLPMFMVHLWLPKAHVEAPVAGSMILAGILLKLGGYGLLRILPLFKNCSLAFNWVWLSLGVSGGVIVSMICLRQSDIKSLIAYSSVAHMGLVMSGLFLFSWWGVGGAMSVMIGHGLCSSGLFCIANMMYERVGSRSFYISKGMLNYMPSMSLWWFLLSVCNMAAPPSLNLLGEISLIMSVVSWSKYNMINVGVLSFLSAAYSLYMYYTVQHGKSSSLVFSFCSGKMREYLVLLLHWLPLNLLILKSDIIMM